MYGEARTPSARYAGKGYAELSAAGGGESEAEHWAVPQSNASGESPRSNATRHNRVESLQDLFPLRGGLMGRSAGGKAHWTVAFFLIFLWIIKNDSLTKNIVSAMLVAVKKHRRHSIRCVF